MFFFARTHFLACEDVAGGSQQSGGNIFFTKYGGPSGGSPLSGGGIIILHVIRRHFLAAAVDPTVSLSMYSPWRGRQLGPRPHARKCLLITCKIIIPPPDSGDPPDGPPYFVKKMFAPDCCDPPATSSHTRKFLTVGTHLVEAYIALSFWSRTCMYILVDRSVCRLQR